MIFQIHATVIKKGNAFAGQKLNLAVFAAKRESRGNITVTINYTVTRDMFRVGIDVQSIPDRT